MSAGPEYLRGMRAALVNAYADLAEAEAVACEDALRGVGSYREAMEARNRAEVAVNRAKRRYRAALVRWVEAARAARACGRDGEVADLEGVAHS